jgi:hypothetical protein
VDERRQTPFDQLVSLGQEIHKAGERLRVDDPPLHEHVTHRLAKRREFAKKTSSRRPRLFLFLVAAERFRFTDTHSLPEIVKSFYAVTDDPTEAKKRAALPWDAHPGKHLLSDLQHSVQQSSKRGDPFQVGIAHGAVSIVARSATPAEKLEVEADDSLLLKFWRPHLVGGRPTLIVFGEPMFVRDDDTFVRDIHRNAEHSLEMAAGKGEVCWPFVARGVAVCAFHLIRWFTRHQIDVDWLGCRRTDQLHKLADHRFGERANVVVIGSVRSNGILADYQREPITVRSLGASRAATALPYALREDGLVGTQPNRDIGKDQLTQSPFEAWSLVGRRDGIADGTITIIAANFGQVIARIGEFLTNEELFQGFVDRQAALKSALSATLPSQFQVPIKMSFYDHGTVPGHYEFEEAWFEQSPEI